MRVTLEHRAGALAPWAQFADDTPMEAIARPLRRLAEELRWFVNASEVRVLRVLSDSSIRRAALRLIQSFEFMAGNCSPFLTIEDALTRADPGWSSRAQRLRTAHQRRRETMIASELAPAELAPRSVSGDSFVAFASELAAVDESWRAPMAGTVVVLAPTLVEDQVGLAASLRALLRAPGLAGVRWITLEVDVPHARLEFEELQSSVFETTCRFDQSGFERELGEIAKRAQSGTSGLSRAGAAWPAGATPPRIPGHPGTPGPELAEQLTAAGVDPRTILGDLPTRLPALILGAALSLRAGEGDRAIAEQRQARDLCKEAGLVGPSLILSMGLAAYLGQLGHNEAALAQYREAANEGEAARQPGLAAQAHLAAGLLLSQRGAYADAGVHQHRAAVLADNTGATFLAIEAWRLCGHTMAAAQRTDVTVDCWSRAVALAQTDPDLARISSAPEVARRLARLYRDGGYTQHADALDHQALVFEGRASSEVAS